MQKIITLLTVLLTSCAFGTSNPDKTQACIANKIVDLDPGVISVCNALTGKEDVEAFLPDLTTAEQNYRILQAAVAEQKGMLDARKISILMNYNEDGSKFASYVINQSLFEVEDIRGRIRITAPNPMLKGSRLKANRAQVSIYYAIFEFHPPVFLDPAQTGSDDEIYQVKTMRDLVSMSDSHRFNFFGLSWSGLEFVELHEGIPHKMLEYGIVRTNSVEAFAAAWNLISENQGQVDRSQILECVHEQGFQIIQQYVRFALQE